MKDEQTVVVCVGSDTKTPFDDNKHGHCAECKCDILWRPDVPEPSVKLCMRCGIEAMRQMKAMGAEMEIRSYEGQREEMEKLHGPGALDKAIKLAKAMVDTPPPPTSFYDLTKKENK